MHPAEQATAGQLTHVDADGHGGDSEALGEFLHGHAAALVHERENGAVAFVGLELGPVINVVVHERNDIT